MCNVHAHPRDAGVPSRGGLSPAGLKPNLAYSWPLCLRHYAFPAVISVQGGFEIIEVPKLEFGSRTDRLKKCDNVGQLVELEEHFLLSDYPSSS